MKKVVGELIEELEKVLYFFNHSAANFNLQYEEYVNNIKTIITCLKEDDFSVLGNLVYVIGIDNEIHEIAINNGWEKQFLEINQSASNLIGEIRILRKQEGLDFEGEHDGKYTDKNSYATNPGNLTISDEKWGQIRDSLNLSFFNRQKFNRQRKRIQEYLRFGDTNPAIVISTEPLIVAAYSGDMDAVVLLKFSESFAKNYKLKKYDRMITVNVYTQDLRFDIKHDIFVGSKYSGSYIDFFPHIGEFYSSETVKIEKHKKDIPEKHWSYIQTLAEKYIESHIKLCRRGFWFAP